MHRPEEVPSRKWHSPALTERQINIEEWWDQQRPPFEGHLGKYMSNAIDQSEGDDFHQLFVSLMDQLIEYGEVEDRQSALAYRRTRTYTGHSGDIGLAHRGIIIEGRGFILQELRINTLSSDAVDFGERIKLSAVMEEAPKRGDESEIHQSTVLHFCAWSGWILQSRPDRIPPLPTVSEMDRKMRESEILSSRRLSTLDGQEVNGSVLHIGADDARPTHHYRDFRTVSLFLAADIISAGIHSIRIIEVEEANESNEVLNFAFGEQGEEWNSLYFVAFRGHTRWLHPSILTGVDLWKSWGANSDCVRDIVAL